MEQERRLTLDCCERFNVPDMEGYLDLYQEGALLWGYGPGPIQGKAEIRAFYQGIFEAFSDIRLHADDVFTCGDRLAMRFRMGCRHTGSFMGVPATGRSGELHGITILRFEGGRCAERWSSADFLGLLAQFGALGTVSK